MVGPPLGTKMMAKLSKKAVAAVLKKKMKKNIVCPCSRTFSYLGNYKYHMRWECGKVLSCRLCDKVFKDKPYLTKHSRWCKGAATAESAMLQQHRRDRTWDDICSADF